MKVVFWALSFGLNQCAIYIGHKYMKVFNGGTCCRQENLQISCQPFVFPSFAVHSDAQVIAFISIPDV